MLSSQLSDTKESIMDKQQEGERKTDDIPCKRKIPKEIEKKERKRSDKDFDEEYMEHGPMKKRPKSKKKKKQKQNKQNKTPAEQKQQKKQQSSIASSNSTSQSKKEQIQQPKQQKIEQPAIKKSRSKSKKKKTQSRQRSSQSKQKKQPIQRKKAKGYVYKPPKQKPIQKQESINEIMRQYSRISRKKKRKSNFYLDKIDSMKWGEPVGRGAKKKKQKLQEINRRRKELEKQRKKQEKRAKEQFLLNKQAQLNSVKVQQVVLSESQNDVKIQEKDKPAIKNKNEFDINIYVLENLIDLYTINFYDIQVLSKGLHQLPLKKIRFNCQVLFERCLSKLLIQSGKQMSQNQRQAIISQLFQPKVTNKLINSKDAQLNQYFNKLLYSIHKPTIVMEEKETNYLLTKMQSFSLVSKQTDCQDISLNLEVKQE